MFFADLPMTRFDSTARFDLATLQRVIADEAAAERQRRGAPVSSHDPIVRDRVCTRLLRQADRVHQGGDASVFTELVADEEEPPDAPWAKDHAAA